MSAKHAKYVTYDSRWKRAAETFRVAQLRDGSFYSDLRAFLPLFAILVVWLWVVPRDLFRGAFLESTITLRHLLLALAMVGLWNLWLGLSMFTHRSTKKDLLAEVSRLTAAAIACGALPLFANLARGTDRIALWVAAATTVTLLVLSFGFLCAFYLGALFSHRLLRPRLAIIVGSGRRAADLRNRLRHHYARFDLLGCVDQQYHGADATADNYLGTLDALPELLKTQPVEVVLIALPMKSKYDLIQRTIDVCELIGVESHYMHDIFETSRAQMLPQARQHRIYSPVGTVSRDPKQWMKRGIDIVGSMLLLVLFSPLMLAAAVAVALTSPGPILFVQQRYGQNRKRFPMFKFRSMVADAEKRQAALETRNEAQGPVFKLRADPRVTRVGAFLRRTSIDELPQLFNVLRGEMSLVGPRPLPLRDVSKFEESWLLRRFSVKPGLTCLWQVNGRSNTSFEFWIRQDLAYIDGWSLALDLKILFLTIPAVLKGSGAV